MRGLADFRQPELAVERFARNPGGDAPGLLVADHVAVIVAGEGELAGQMPVRVLIHHVADIAGIVA
jgi:hypothetical protein